MVVVMACVMRIAHKLSQGRLTLCVSVNHRLVCRPSPLGECALRISSQLFSVLLQNASKTLWQYTSVIYRHPPHISHMYTLYILDVASKFRRR